MRFRESFRLELSYQARRFSTWLYLAVLVFFGFAQMVGGVLPGARSGGYFLEAPFAIAQATAFCTLIWLMLAAYVAGDAAARDVESGMHPLSYAAPVDKAEYLGGRFAAALVLNAVILLGAPVGIWLGQFAPEVEVAVRGPFQPMAYLAVYALIALPGVFVGTAVQFACAALGRRAVASYVGGVLLWVTTYAAAGGMLLFLDLDFRRWLDPIGVMGLLADDPTSGWTPTELNTRLTWLDGSLVASRLLWIGIALAVLAFTHVRFRFRHPVAGAWWSRASRGRGGELPTHPPAGTADATAISVPDVRRSFDLGGRVAQLLAVAWQGFAMVVRRPTSLILLAIVALFALVGVADPELVGVPGVPLVPRTDYVLFGLWNPGFPPGYLIIPVLIVYWSGELVWREREAGLSEIVDAAPVPDWVLFLGRFLGLGFLLVACIAIRMAVGVLVQVANGVFDIQFGQYARLLFGLQLTDSLLLGLLALALHAALNQKPVGHVVAIVAIVLGIGGPQLGIDELLAFGFDPGWVFTDMRGFGASLGPSLWHKAYWTAWAALFAVLATLLWVRGREEGLGARFRKAIRGFAGPAAWTATAAVALGIALGGFIFYNTTVLNASGSASEQIERLARYERLYGQFAGAPQPRLTGTSLEVEIDPDRRSVEIHGTYRLVNDGAVPIDSVHLAPASDVGTIGVEFDRSAVLVLDDEALRHRIYALAEPLEPGDSLGLDFAIRYEPRGFPDSGVDVSVVANGTYLLSQEWLPGIGYQRFREISDPDLRRTQGLGPRPAIPSLYDVEARANTGWDGKLIDLDVVVGTAEGQTAIAPGVLRETWTEGGRRYFRYSTDAPIGNEYAIASADYDMHAAEWNEVEIEIFHDPDHTAHLARTVESVRASLEHYAEQFGPYPYSYLRLVEQGGPGFGLHSDAGTIAYREWFTLMNPEVEPGSADIPFAVVAHEVGHQWWGAQLGYAFVEGAGILSESLAWYSAIGVVEDALGRQEMRRLLRWMRGPYPSEPENVPLLRAADDYLYYRKGPFAMFALSEYLGADQVSLALRRLLAAHRAGEPPLPTTLDLLRELAEVTPDSLRPLLHDLFEVNTTWAFETESATAEPRETGTWQVTLDVRAQKVATDTLGVATDVPIDDWVEVGVFAPNGAGDASGEELGEPLYLEMHRIDSTEQTITVTVPREPARAGIDPYHLLDWERLANTAEVDVGG